MLLFYLKSLQLQESSSLTAVIFILTASGVSGCKGSSCHEKQLSHLGNVISLAFTAVIVSCYGLNAACEAFSPCREQNSEQNIESLSFFEFVLGHEIVPSHIIL